jgi:hypothetical protein
MRTCFAVWGCDCPTQLSLPLLGPISLLTASLLDSAVTGRSAGLAGRVTEPQDCGAMDVAD